MADDLVDATELADVARESGLVAMVCHTRRFNPSHQWMRQRFASGELQLQHLVAQTYFFRRTNTNALGRLRTWTDHLLWHHACHTVDLFQHQTGETAERVSAVQGPPHPELGIAMDMSVSMTAPSGAVCSLALSFNNDGPFGTDFRYVCDKGTFVARYDDLVDGRDTPIDVSAGHVSTDGIELQDREFFASIREGREPESSAAQRPRSDANPCTAWSKPWPSNARGRGSGEVVEALRVLDQDSGCGRSRRGRRRPAGPSGRRRRACGSRWDGASRCPTGPGRPPRRSALGPAAPRRHKVGALRR